MWNLAEALEKISEIQSEAWKTTRGLFSNLIVLPGCRAEANAVGWEAGNRLWAEGASRGQVHLPHHATRLGDGARLVGRRAESGWFDARVGLWG